MKVEIWSDVACPFCYIGKKHFEAALASVPFKDKVEVEWKSFQLDPSIPNEGINMTSAEYLEKHKGYPKEQLDAMFEQLKKQGEGVGINFRNDISIPANTFRAQRLIHLAKTIDKAAEMEEALFYAHFTEGKDVNDTDVLVELAKKIGFDSEKAKTFILSEEKSDEVKSEIIEASQLKIQGVPFFVVDRKYGISGAQPIEVFTQALTQAFEESQPQFDMKGGDTDNTCGPDGCEV